ncbi:RNA-directed DNA polymerase from mobile element jockey [Araneus ventricosus]|uniref:RNA-directed DNA polymerase from mobile element jockey n=1 Tax=Araneus ventricosus TaxID=182803 RepID=A0A4Y2EJW3_ARAVE|nr:RNA-directed DNA polymerase from mobile element jockey [Araneus ventricosus]
MNDIPQQKGITLSLYADDTAILAQGKKFSTISNSLSSHIPKLESWLKRWKIQLNVEKTEAIIFSKYFKHCPEIKIYNTPVPWKKEIKYLGVILDRNLTFRPHLNHIKNKYNKAFRAQYSFICSNSRLSTQNKLLIYQAYLRPILTYASPVWAFTQNPTLISFRYGIGWKTKPWHDHAGRLVYQKCRHQKIHQYPLPQRLHH